MTQAAIIRASELAERGWKNGGGTTREVAAFPAGAGLDDFLWRLSIAKVDLPGAFSCFPGVDRVIAIARGSLHLHSTSFDMVLEAGDAPLTFDGELPVDATPRHGAVLDINAMARRNRYRADMTRLNAGDTIDWRRFRFLVALDPQRFGGRWLNALDTIEPRGSGHVEGRCVAIGFHAIQAI